MGYLVLDTDAASSLHRGDPPASLLRALSMSSPAITFATRGELAKWMAVRRWGPRRRSEVKAFIAGLTTLPYDREVARRWGEITAYAQLRGRPKEAKDTWIAACCIVRGLPLATLNTKDFTDFAEHEGLELVPVSRAASPRAGRGSWSGRRRGRRWRRR